MENVPYFSDIAEAPAGGIAHRLTTSDGVAIRTVHWPLKGAKGTVLMFPGRTEYIEKYGRAAGEFQARGYAMIAVDWRGQGLADRLAEPRGMGHVVDFHDYQKDVTALLEHAKALKLTEPFFLCGHSMGGCIGLRALYNGLPVRAAMFSAPMWGIKMALHLRPFAWALSSIARLFGKSVRMSPGYSAENYVGKTPFGDNLLTTDTEMFDYMEDQLAAQPQLGLGGPSLHWLNEALREMLRMTHMASPSTPVLTFLGTAEEIVEPHRIKSRMAKWSNGKLVVIPTAKHEVMMETPEIRNDVFDQTTAFFDSHL